MKQLGNAAWRAYRHSWTGGLVLFELVGAALIARHSRTAHIWPFLVWAACVPVVRLLYLQGLHASRPMAWTRRARLAYGIAAWLFVFGVILAFSGAALVLAVADIHGVLRYLAAYAGLWGAIPAILVLAFFLVLLVAALLVWLALTTLAYTEAAVDPEVGPLAAIRRGLGAIKRRSSTILGVAALQGLFVFAALGGQLFERSGIALAPMVWPATLFGPVVLSLFLTLAEAARSSRGCTSGFEPLGHKP